MNRPQALLCDDFDTLTTPRPEWASTGTGLIVDTTGYQSQPQSLHITKTGTATSTLSYMSTTSPTTSTLEASVQVAQDGTSAPNAVGLLYFAAGGGQKLIFTVVPGLSDAGTADARCAVSSFGSTGTGYNSFPFTRGTWHTVLLKIEPGANNTYNLTCKVDNIDHGWNGATANTALGAITGTVGLVSSATGTVETRFDNVALDFQ